MKRKILFVEDEMILGQLVRESLEKSGYDVLHVLNGSDALPAFNTYGPHLCLLDIMLPGTDGYTLAVQVRTLDAIVPLIFLTAKVQATDLVKGFSAGCNDYVRKPFNMDELLLRIENWMNVTYGTPDTTQKDTYKIGVYVFDKYRQLLSSHTQDTRLSHKESELLAILCSHRNTIVSRDHILQSLWGGYTVYSSRILDVYIARLRKYLKEDTHVEIITLRGIGYRLIFN